MDCYKFTTVFVRCLTRSNSILQYNLIDLFSRALLFLALTCATLFGDGKSPLSFSKTDSYCEAFHGIHVETSHHGSDNMYDTDTGANFAAVDLEPGPGVGGSNPWEFAAGDGFSHATVVAQSGGSTYLTAAIASIDYAAGDDASDLSRAELFGDFTPMAWAEYEISDTEFDFGWIEGDIVWQGFGEADDESPIEFDSSTTGQIYVGDSSLTFETYADVTHVYGMLSDLDGPHEVNDYIPGSVATYHYRQQVTSTEEFSAGSQFEGGAQITADQEEGTLEKELFGYGYAYSTIKAYMGDPDE